MKNPSILQLLNSLVKIGSNVLKFTILFNYLVIVLLIYRGNMVLRKEINWVRILIYFLLGFIVYIRFFVMLSHSFGHYFFTYRAQAASVLALCFMILEIVEFRKVPKKGDKKNDGIHDSYALSE